MYRDFNNFFFFFFATTISFLNYLLPASGNTNVFCDIIWKIKTNIKVVDIKITSTYTNSHEIKLLNYEYEQVNHGIKFSLILK